MAIAEIMPIRLASGMKKHFIILFSFSFSDMFLKILKKLIIEFKLEPNYIEI